MNGKLIIPVLSILISPLTFAMSAFPNAPEISDPVADEENVELVTTLSTEVMTSTNNNPESTTVEFDGALWYLSDEFDTSLQLLGGVQYVPASEVLYQNGSYTHQISPELGITFNGQVVHTLTIFSSGSMNLLSESSEQIGSVVATPSDPSNTKASASQPFILVKENAGSISVRWVFSHNSYPSDVSMEVELRNDDTIRILANPSSYDDVLYASENGGNVGVSISGFSYNQTLPQWKTTYSETVDNFGLEFSVNTENEIVVTPAASVTLGDFEAPEFVVEEAEGYDHETTLEPFKEYIVYARHRAQITNGDSTNNMISALSAPVYFSTVTSDYELNVATAPQLTAGAKQTLTFTLTNEGTYAGEPQVTVKLPFAVLSGISSIGGGDIAAALNAQLEGGTCTVDVTEAGPVIITCSGIALDENDSVSVSVDVVFASESTQAIEYGVCETLSDDCDSASLTQVELQVAAPEEPTPEEPAPETPTTQEPPAAAPDSNSEDDDSSSSGGGSMFWLTLLALPLLRLRRSA